MYKNTIMLYRIQRENHKKIQRIRKHVQNSCGKWLAVGICGPRCGFQRSDVRSPMVRALDVARRQAATPSPPVQRSPMLRALEIARRQAATSPPPVQPVAEQETHPPCYMVPTWTEWQPGEGTEGRDGRRVRYDRHLYMMCPDCGRGLAD